MAHSKSINTEAPLHTLFKHIANDYPQGRHRQELYEIVRITLKDHVLGHNVTIQDLMSKYHVWSSYAQQKGIDVKYAEELDDYLHGYPLVSKQTVGVKSSFNNIGSSVMLNLCMLVIMCRFILAIINAYNFHKHYIA